MKRIYLTPRRMDLCSIFLFMIGLILSFYSPLHGYAYLTLNASVYGLSLTLMYISKKFRQFAIYPTSTYRPSENPYYIYPWIPEGEVRWPAKLKRITIEISNSLILKELLFSSIPLIKDEEPIDNPPAYISINKKSKPSSVLYSISFNPTEGLEVNAFVKLIIEQNDKVEMDFRPFIEYTIEYEPPIPFFIFKYRKRIF